MSEILVNTTTIGSQHQSAVAMVSPAPCCVVWRDGSDRAIKGQMFVVDGNKVGGEFVVNAPTLALTNVDRRLPTIAAAGVGFIVAWIEQPHVKLQAFRPDGQKYGPETQVSTTDVDLNSRPAIASLSDGGFVVIWVDARREQRIRAQQFNYVGTKTRPEFTVNSIDGLHASPIVTRLVDGNYVVAWRGDPAPAGGGRLTFRIVDPEGSPMGGEVTPDLFGFTGAKAMTTLDNGGFVIVNIRSGGVSGIGVEKSTVEANVYEANGAHSQSMSLNSAPGINCSVPDVAPLPGGRFLVAWVQKSAETFATSESVMANVFSASQGPVGQEVQVNTTTAGGRFGVRVATLYHDAAAFVVWTDSSGTGGDTSELAVHGRALQISPPGILVGR